MLDPGKDVHIWLVNLSSFQDSRTSIDLQKLTQFCFPEAHVTREELKESNSYRSKYAVKNFLIRRSVRRLILNKYSGIPPKDILIEQFSSYEKPQLDKFQNPGINFSCSDSGDYLAVAIAKDSEIGVDIEMNTRLTDKEMFDLSRRFLSDGEFALLTKQASLRARRDLFFTIWVMKEARLKLTGEGFRRSPKSFTVLPHMILEGVRDEGFSQKKNEITYRLFSPARGYVGATAYETNGSPRALTLKRSSKFFPAGFRDFGVALDTADLTVSLKEG